MYICAGGVEERDVCLCLVFVSLSQHPLTRSHATLKTLYYHLQSPFAHLVNLIRFGVPDVVRYGTMQFVSHGKVGQICSTH